MTYHLFLPALLTLGVGLAIQLPLGARTTTSPGRVGAAALVMQALVLAGGVVLAYAWLQQPTEDRCSGANDWLGQVIVAVIFGAAALGGVAVAAAIADRRRHSATLVWHVLVVPLALGIPYLIGFAAIVVAFSCLS